MIKLGLVGKRISNSQSKQMYEKLLGRPIDYSLFDFERPDDIPKLEKLFQDVDGLSITAPFKDHFLKDVMVESEVRLLGAINCIKNINKNYIGTNTDFFACRDILSPYFIQNYKFFILGDGAMSRVIKYILKQHKQDYVILSRRLKNLNKFNFCEEKDNYFIINTCNKNYVFDGITDHRLVRFWDLNYNVEIPVNSTLYGNEKYLDGLDLLYLQAKYALDFWKINIP